MENQVRVEFEKFIDKIEKDPETYHQTVKNSLYIFGIEPDLDSILSYISGAAWTNFEWHNKYLNIEITDEIENEFIEIMRRRAWELRQVFIRLRNK